MVYFHGTDDFVCPYEGTGPEWYDPPREETARRWGRHNNCSNEDPEIEQVSELAQRWVWSGCAAPTEYYKIEDFGHTWPGCAPCPLPTRSVPHLSRTDSFFSSGGGSLRKNRGGMC